MVLLVGLSSTTGKVAISGAEATGVPEVVLPPVKAPLPALETRISGPELRDPSAESPSDGPGPLT